MPGPQPWKRCPNCGLNLLKSLPSDYVCRRCGRFLDRMYRREHVDPAVGRRLTIAQIQAEYRAVGWPLPGWLP